MKHFGNKEGLLETIFDDGWARLEYIFRALQDLPSPVDKLEGLLDLVVAGFDRDPELKALMLLEGRRIRKQGQQVVLTAGYMRFIEMIDSILAEMRAAGQLRPEVHPQAARSALVAIAEGLMRDQVLAQRMDYPAHYDSGELRKIFRVLMSALASASAPEAAVAQLPAAPAER